MTEKNAIIYARVSSAGQAERELPLESQLQQCRDKAEALGLTVVKEFVDAGVSASSDRRPEFQNAVAFCETIDIDMFITWSSSRFARNKLDAGLYKRRLEQVGTRLVYVSMDVDVSTDSGWFMDSLMEIVDEHYSRQTRADTVRSLLKNAREGFFNGGRPPFGYTSQPSDRNPKRKELVIEPDEAEVVRLIFDKKRRDGMGIRGIAFWLNDHGYENRGSKWTKSTVANILKSRAVIGQAVYNRKDNKTGLARPESEWVIVNSHQPIIEKTVWESVQGGATGAVSNIDRGGTANSHHIFTGLLYCGECGARLRTESAKGRSSTYHYYNCSAAALDKVHENRRIPAPDLDQWLLPEILDAVVSERTLKQVVDEVKGVSDQWEATQAQKRSAIVRKISATERKTARLYELMEDSDPGLIQLSDLAPRLKKNNATVKKLQRELALIDSESAPCFDPAEIPLSALYSQVVGVIESSHPRKIREFLSTFISSIVVEPEKIVVNYDLAALMGSPVSGSLALVSGSQGVQPGEPFGRSMNRWGVAPKRHTVALPGKWRKKVA